MNATRKVTIHQPMTWLALTRFLCGVLVFLSLAFFVLAAPARYHELADVTSTTLAPFTFRFIVSPEAGFTPLQLAQADEPALRSLGISPKAYAGFIMTCEVMIIVCSALIGGVIFWRRPDDQTAVFWALGFILLLQPLFSGVFDETNQFAIVSSTLAIAALFHPLRQRIQNAIDRRFYRRKYDAEHTLAVFGSVVREETDLERLAARLALVVEETLQPEHVFLWLRR